MSISRNPCIGGNFFVTGPSRQDYTKTTLLYCKLGQHIHRDGFDDRNKLLARETVCYVEPDSAEANASMHFPDFAHVISEEEAAAIICDTFFITMDFVLFRPKSICDL